MDYHENGVHFFIVSTFTPIEASFPRVTERRRPMSHLSFIVCVTRDRSSTSLSASRVCLFLSSRIHVFESLSSKKIVQSSHRRHRWVQRRTTTARRTRAEALTTSRLLLSSHANANANAKRRTNEESLERARRRIRRDARARRARREGRDAFERVRMAFRDDRRE